MDTKDIKDLIQAFSSSNILHFHYKKDGMELSLDKSAAKAVYQPIQPFLTEIHEPAHSIHIEQDVPTVPNSTLKQDIVTPTATGDITLVTAPLVGIYYIAANTDDPAFVKEGQSIKKGDTLCIIESMTVLNEIKAARDGKVQTIWVNNGDMVEFGQALMEITNV
ncbi:MAG: acetyl-CoA carboxylase biotin carboxyl carrier protein [Defluviitaleaceae bacterium]|nr:acetyl-CoA carboxylase biotin carboxyl carrier protein [Defluviitaleaceae bacterium]